MRLFEAPDELELDCGRRLGPIDVAYETYGQMDADGENVVLICHALSGDAHVAGRYNEDDRKPGWWDAMVGPGKGIDTNRYFVICSNFLGGCKGTTGPSSINPATGERWGLDFPVITIADMVRVQKALLDALGIRRLLAVVGGSMGGMQVLEWATRYGDFVRAAIPVATTTRLNAQSIGFDAIGRHAIIGDPHFELGHYTNDQPPSQGLAIARMIGHITYLSEEGMHAKFGRQLRHEESYRYDFDSEFSVETYLDHQGQRFVERFDANSYLYITKAMDYFDLPRQYGSLERAFADSQCRWLVLSFSSDWLFTPRQSQEMVRALLTAGKEVSYCNIQSPYGHDAFLLEPETLGKLIAGFLNTTYNPPRYDRLADAVGDKGRVTTWPTRKMAYDMIESLIEPAATVLDLGCGRGDLLAQLIAHKGVRACGIEIDQQRLIECVSRGIAVIQADVDQGLPQFADLFDWVILSQTLQEVRYPNIVLSAMLEAGHNCLVSFPNLAHWRSRLRLLIDGVAPVTERLPYNWYDTPNIHLFSLKDFERYCRQLGARIVQRFPLAGNRNQPVRILPNLLAEESLYHISSR